MSREQMGGGQGVDDRWLCRPPPPWNLLTDTCGQHGRKPGLGCESLSTPSPSPSQELCAPHQLQATCKASTPRLEVKNLPSLCVSIWSKAPLPFSWQVSPASLCDTAGSRHLLSLFYMAQAVASPWRISALKMCPNVWRRTRLIHDVVMPMEERWNSMGLWCEHTLTWRKLQVLSQLIAREA